MNKKNNLKKSYTDIKTYEDSLLVLKPDEDCIIYNTDTKKIIAFKKLMHIYSVINYLNNNWQPDWLDGDQYKYYSYFKAESNSGNSGVSGFGFSYLGYNYGGLWSRSGSCLCTYNSDVAQYIGKQFEDIYNDYLK
jgi:hypothetical protein